MGTLQGCTRKVVLYTCKISWITFRHWIIWCFFFSEKCQVSENDDAMEGSVGVTRHTVLMSQASVSDHASDIEWGGWCNPHRHCLVRAHKKKFNANPKSLPRSNWVIGVWVWVLGVISLHVEDQEWLRVRPPSEWPCRESTFWLHRRSDLCVFYSLLTNEPANPKLTNLGTARWKVDKLIASSRSWSFHQGLASLEESGLVKKKINWPTFLWDTRYIRPELGVMTGG